MTSELPRSGVRLRSFRQNLVPVFYVGSGYTVAVCCYPDMDSSLKMRGPRKRWIKRHIH